MRVDLLFDPFGGRVADVLDAALAAEHAGFDGVWLYDHLAGSVHGASHVLECWTTLTAVAATLQEVSGGRLLLGLGAGGGRHTPYPAEQLALGRPVPGDAARRASVEAAIATLRSVWSGTVNGVGGYLRPEPPPPIVVGAFGPRMAEVAGRLADGITTPGGPHLPELAGVAREAHARAGRNPAAFVVTASAAPSPAALDRLHAAGVDRAIVFVPPPYVDAVGRVAAALA